jgi:hypothetical protein
MSPELKKSIQIETVSIGYNFSMPGVFIRIYRKLSNKELIVQISNKKGGTWLREDPDIEPITKEYELEK